MFEACGLGFATGLSVKLEPQTKFLKQFLAHSDKATQHIHNTVSELLNI